MHPIRSSTRPRMRQAGFSLVELMVASAVGLVILAGMATLFVNNSRTQAEIEKANRQIENGRYGMQLLSTDLTNAGYYGEFDPTPLATPVTLPNICATNLDGLRAGLPLAVQGVDMPAASALTCLSDRKPGTDVLAVRRTQTCVAGAGNCAPTSAGGMFLQASLCNDANELGSGNPAHHYGMHTDPAELNRHKRDCTALAEVRRYLVNIYYVANNNLPGDGIPTLKRAELGGTDGLAFSIVPLVEGIENFQVEYGVGGGFSAEPATLASWRQVTGVRVHLLSRNLSATTGHTDTKDYTLGRTADGGELIVPATNDGFKRHVFQSQVVLRNPAGRIM